jgi:hypothetical protein
MWLRTLLLAVLVGATLRGQGPNPARDTVNWAVGIASQFALVSNPVVSIHSLARLGQLTCEQDRSAAAGMFRQAIIRINTIPADIFFDDKVPLLPISSFSGLWRMVATDAVKCEPGLALLINTPAFEQRRNDERQRATNSLIARATNRFPDDPERAAQLMDLLLTAGDPGAMDYDALELFLAQLRDRAPELGDQVFGKAVDTVVTAPIPSADALNLLGKYLFVDPGQWHLPDVRNLFKELPVGGSTLFDFRRLRSSASPEAVGLFVQALVRLTGSTVRYDTTIAYGLAFQTLMHARELELAVAGDLERLLPQLAAYSNAAVAAAVGGTVPDPDGETSRRSQRVREVLTAVARKRFADARVRLSAVADAATTRQLEPVVDFAEAAAAITAGELQRAVQLTNSIQPGGVKRSLLYAGIVTVADPRIGDGLLGLATKDTNDLPSEFRAAMFCALSVALLDRNPDGVLSMLQDAVVALNAARVAPRQARFDPRRTRSTTGSAPGAGATTDVVGIPQAVHRFFELIDTGQNRHNYELVVPGVALFTLPEVILRAQTIDPQRLEVLASGLRDANKQAEALLAVAQLRFKKVQ